MIRESNMFQILVSAFLICAVPSAVAQCGDTIWRQNFEFPTVSSAIDDVNGVAFPAIQSLPGAPPSAKRFDASYPNEAGTGARVAYTANLAETHFAPYDLLYGEYSDILDSNDRDTCVIYRYQSNRNSLVEDDGNQVLQVDFPKGCVGKACGLAARVDLDALALEDGLPPLEEATLTYRFKFMKGFKFGKGGKLPGVCGGLCDNGCKPSSGLTGWSARHMWIQCLPKTWEQLLIPTQGDRECTNKFITYPYHTNKVLKCGDEYAWANADGSNIEADTGKWHELTTYVKMNTAGPTGQKESYIEDGAIKTWLDGKLVLEENEMLWRKYDNITIKYFFMSTFFGGSDDTWGSPQDQYIRYDDFEVKQGLCSPTNAKVTVDPYKYHSMADTTVGQGTNTIGKVLSGLSEKDCWKACVDTDGGACLSALHTAANTCTLLDSHSEHRLERLSEKQRATLLYPATRREMTMPVVNWKGEDGLTIDTSTPCPILFAAMSGEFSAPPFAKYATKQACGGPYIGKLGRKEQCGGDRNWVAANPPSVATTCKGFLHCHFFDAEVSVCERTRDVAVAPGNTCTRVQEGAQCGGDQAWVDKANAKGGICCAEHLDCVYESPTMARCVEFPEMAEEMDPFGPPYGRPHIAPLHSKCGGSVFGTALSDMCEEGLYCEYREPFFAKCVLPGAAAKDFTSIPAHECGGLGDQCMGDREYVAGLGLDGAGDPRVGRCCQGNLRCVFQGSYYGICDDPNKYTQCPRGEDCTAGRSADASAGVIASGPIPDTRPRTLKSGAKCGGSTSGTPAETCEEGLFCQYTKPFFAKCVKANSSPAFEGNNCGSVGTQCMGSESFVAGLGDGRDGECCKDGLDCVFMAPYVGMCADPALYTSADAFPITDSTISEESGSMNAKDYDAGSDACLLKAYGVPDPGYTLPGHKPDVQSIEDDQLLSRSDTTEPIVEESRGHWGVFVGGFWLHVLAICVGTLLVLVQ